jgi:hypothetical protein
MKRTVGLLVTLAALGGCVSTQNTSYAPGVAEAQGHLPARPPVLQGFVGPWGQPVLAPEGMPQAPVKGNHAQAMSAKGAAKETSEIMQASFHTGTPGHGPAAGPSAHDFMSARPGGQGLPPPGMLNAAGALIQGPQSAFPISRSQLRFVGPVGGKIGWQVAGAEQNGKPVMIPHQLDIPGRYNFLQASIYRLKLSDIPGKPGLELYPTIEVVPANSKTQAFLAHNYIPVEFTDSDLDQVALGNYLTKVIYLPDPQYQTAATGAAGTSELVSTQLEAGVDPIAEAHRRGSILLVIRVGGIQLEAANTPPLDNPGVFGGPGGMGLMMPGGPAPEEEIVPMQTGPSNGPMPVPAAAPSGFESKPVSFAPAGPTKGRQVRGLLDR